MRILTFLLLLITGLGMAVPGLYLASLGGSFYYLIAGILVLVCAALFALLPPSNGNPVAAPSSAAASSEGGGDWSHYGGSQHATRYSPLTQITPANAGRLEEAWTYHAGLQQRDTHSAHQYEATPL